MSFYMKKGKKGTLCLSINHGEGFYFYQWEGNVRKRGLGFILTTSFPGKRGRGEKDD